MLRYSSTRISNWPLTNDRVLYVICNDDGKPLLFSTIEKLIKDNEITIIYFIGRNSDKKLINRYAKLLRGSTIEKIVDSFTTTKDIRLSNKIKIPAGTVIKRSKRVPNPIKIGWHCKDTNSLLGIDSRNFDYIQTSELIQR